MVKHVATVLTLFLIGVAFAEEDAALKELLGRVPGLLEVSKPALKFLQSQHMTNEAKQIETDLAELDKLVNHSDHSLFSVRVLMLGSERRLIAYTKSALVKRAEILEKKATEAIGKFPHLAETIKKEQAEVKHQANTLSQSVGPLDKNIQLEKENIVVQDRLEATLNKAH